MGNSLVFIKEFHTEVWTTVLSSMGFILYSLVCSVAMCFLYANEKTKIPFWLKQLKAFGLANAGIGASFTLLYLICSYFNVLLSLGKSGVTLSEVLFSDFNFTYFGVLFFVLAISLNYCMLRFKLGLDFLGNLFWGLLFFYSVSDLFSVMGCSDIVRNSFSANIFALHFFEIGIFVITMLNFTTTSPSQSNQSQTAPNK